MSCGCQTFSRAVGGWTKINGVEHLARKGWIRIRYAPGLVKDIHLPDSDVKLCEVHQSEDKIPKENPPDFYMSTDQNNKSVKSVTYLYHHVNAVDMSAACGCEIYSNSMGKWLKAQKVKLLEKEFVRVRYSGLEKDLKANDENLKMCKMHQAQMTECHCQFYSESTKSWITVQKVEWLPKKMLKIKCRGNKYENVKVDSERLRMCLHHRNERHKQRQVRVSARRVRSSLVRTDFLLDRDQEFLVTQYKDGVTAKVRIDVIHEHVWITTQVTSEQVAYSLRNLQQIMTGFDPAIIGMHERDYFCDDHYFTLMIAKKGEKSMTMLHFWTNETERYNVIHNIYEGLPKNEGNMLSREMLDDPFVYGDNDPESFFIDHSEWELMNPQRPRHSIQPPFVTVDSFQLHEPPRLLGISEVVNDANDAEGAQDKKDVEVKTRKSEGSQVTEVYGKNATSTLNDTVPEPPGKSFWQQFAGFFGFFDDDVAGDADQANGSDASKDGQPLESWLVLEPATRKAVGSSSQDVDPNLGVASFLRNGTRRPRGFAYGTKQIEKAKDEEHHESDTHENFQDEVDDGGHDASANESTSQQIDKSKPAKPAKLSWNQYFSYPAGRSEFEQTAKPRSKKHESSKAQCRQRAWIPSATESAHTEGRRVVAHITSPQVVRLASEVTGSLPKTSIRNATGKIMIPTIKPWQPSSDGAISLLKTGWRNEYPKQFNVCKNDNIVPAGNAEYIPLTVTDYRGDGGDDGFCGCSAQNSQKKIEVEVVAESTEKAESAMSRDRDNIEIFEKEATSAKRGTSFDQDDENLDAVVRAAKRHQTLMNHKPTKCVSSGISVIKTGYIEYPVHPNECRECPS